MEKLPRTYKLKVLLIYKLEASRVGHRCTMVAENKSLLL